MRTTILILLSLLFMGGQQAKAQLKPAKRWATVYEMSTYKDLPMVKLGLGWAAKPIKVANGGQAPGIVTLTTAFNRVWKIDVVEGVLNCAKEPNFTRMDDEEYGTFTIVDRRNGYLCEDAGGTDGESMEACVWRRDNGHRLFAIEVGSNCDPEIAVICFYDYDPATQTLTPESSPADTFRPQEGDYYSFGLPQHGKDFTITEYLLNTSENAISVYKWDGQKHVFSHKKTEPSE